MMKHPLDGCKMENRGLQQKMEVIHNQVMDHILLRMDMVELKVMVVQVEYLIDQEAVEADFILMEHHI